MFSESLPLNPFQGELELGEIVSVNQAVVEAVLRSGNDGSGEAAKDLPRANVGEFVVVRCGETIAFGQIRSVQHKAGNGSNGHSAPKGVAILQLLTSLDLKTGSVSRGILEYPRVDQKVYLANAQFIQYVMQYDRHQTKDGAPLLLRLAELHDQKRTPLAFTPERLFGAHLAILGTTGAGKSWSVSRLVGECGQHRCKVILFDATGEYFTLEQGVRHVTIGRDPQPAVESEEAAVPYHDLTEGDLFAIFRPTGESQAPKLKAAMKSLKLARLSPGIAVDGLIVKAHKPKQQFESEWQRHIAEIESPYATFDIRHLTRQIEHECVSPQRSMSEPMVWGGPNAMDHSHCVPMINRIEDIIKSDNLASVFRPGKRSSVFKVIHDFLKDSNSHVLRVSLQYLSFAYQTREIIANAIARHLLELARADCFRKMPLLVVLDEAHHFLNKSVDSDSLHYALDSFALIAKEGRKYALTICLATQRPRDIPEDVLSQMGTIICHRLINDRDRGVIERAVGEMDQATLNSIPALTPGEAVIVGVDYSIPMAVKVVEPVNRPHSRGPNYQHYWR